jgi:dTDP-4-amino-4,6-dideoxygalactose transaminase
MTDRTPFLDLGGQTAELRPALDRLWAEVLDTGRFVGGPLVEQFEREWAAYCETPHAIGVANGTDALVLALRALHVGPGDEVVVPTNTFVATAEAVVLVGAAPRFVDVDPATLLITPEAIAAALTPRTRAVMVVHLYGQMPDMQAILAVTTPAGVAVVEDAAQAHGARWRGRPAGSRGVFGCFSFYPGKNLGAFGDGGAVVCSDDVLADRVRSMRDHGRADGSHYVHTEIGTNSRLDALQAGVLSLKLSRLDGWNARRREVMAAYRTALADTAVQLVEGVPGTVGVHHLAVARSDRRDLIRDELAVRGIATGIHYPVPCHLQVPYLRFADGPLPVAEEAAEQVFSLPMHAHLSDAQVARVCEALQQIAGLAVVGRG